MPDAGDLDLGEDRSLLLLDDDEPFLRRLAKAMEKRGFEVETICRLRPGSFHPPPRVDSAVIRLVPRSTPRFAPTPRWESDGEVRPGLTGWAQINGRNNVSWEVKFKLDLWYVDHWSPWLDLSILLKTAWKVINREGINQPGNATAQEFTGSPTNKTQQPPPNEI